MFRLHARIVAKDLDGIIKWLDEIKQEVEHIKSIGHDNPNFLEYNNGEGADFDCNPRIKPFNFESNTIEP